MQKPPYPSIYKTSPTTHNKPIPPPSNSTTTNINTQHPPTIPLSTLTEELDINPTQPSDFQPHLTIFGTNSLNIERELHNRTLKFETFERGKNYIKLCVVDEKQLPEFMGMNLCNIGDEIVGVFECSRNVVYGCVKSVSNKKGKMAGIVKRIKEYFFG